MQILKNMPAVSVIVIFVIVALFALAVIMLFAVCAAYRRETNLAAGDNSNASSLLDYTLRDFAEAYKTFGQETNTPAIISGAINTHMGFALFCERFLANAVSLFVTLGLFGTFLGLSMSVSSLSELLGASNTSEWLGVLDSVGEGLMSALSGMGVAFYTSLVGVACSIVLTILRTVFNPEAQRSALENEMELWLDNRMAPRLKTDRANDDNELVDKMLVGLSSVTDDMGKNLKSTTDAMQATLERSVIVLKAFNDTVNSYNKGTRDFAEFDYNLRGTVAKLDVVVRELSADLKSIKGGR